MKYTIDEKDNGLDISVNDLKEQKQKLLEAFQECQEGRCSCPTEEYKKLDALEIENSDDQIQLHLKSRQGQKIDKNEIDKCLQYTSQRVEQDN